MAQSTPIRPNATVTPVTFYFSLATVVDIAVHFYDVSGAVIASALGGSVTLDVVLPVQPMAGTVREPIELPATEWTPAVSTLVCAAGDVNTLSMPGGHNAAKITPSAVTPPVGGVSYTIAVNLPIRREQT
jgi:hypothetical protein